LRRGALADPITVTLPLLVTVTPCPAPLIGVLTTALCCPLANRRRINRSIAADSQKPSLRASAFHTNETVRPAFIRSRLPTLFSSNAAHAARLRPCN